MAVTEVSYGVFDITGTQTGELIAHDLNKGGVNSISISNQHAATVATLDLYLENELVSGNDIYIIKGVSIPAGTALMLDNTSFNNSVYSLKFTNAGGAPLSIIIR